MSRLFEFFGFPVGVWTPARHPVINTVIGEISTNIYVNVEAKLWEYGKIEEMKKYLTKLQYKYEQELKTGKHQVVILWQMEEKKMVDVWIFGEKESESAGAGVWVYTFSEMERYESANVTAADGLVVLGEEAKKFL